MFYLYILQSQVKPWHYVGITDNIAKRLAKHNSGSVRSTKPYRPLSLVYQESFNNKTDCRKRELSIKNNHALKQALIEKIIS